MFHINVMAGVHQPNSFCIGFVIGAFFSLMSSSFAYEDPLMRQNLSTPQKARAIFKEMGQGMYKSGKGFGKVGALFAGIECVIESVCGLQPSCCIFPLNPALVSSTKRHGQPSGCWFHRRRRPRAKCGTKSRRGRRRSVRRILRGNRPVP